MSKIVCSLFAVVLLAASFREIAAQVPLATGERVRIRAPGLARDDIVGAITQVGGDTLIVEVSWRNQPVRVPLVTVASIDRAWGYQTRTVRGTVIGAALGLLAGVIVFEDDEVGEGGLLVAGAAVGGVIGSRLRVERWRAAPTSTTWIIGGSVEF